MQCSFPSTGIIPFNSTSGLTHSLMLQEINVSTDPAQMVCHAADRQPFILLLAVYFLPHRSPLLTSISPCSRLEDVLTVSNLGWQAFICMIKSLKGVVVLQSDCLILLRSWMSQRMW